MTAATTKKPTLPDFEGNEVSLAAVRITNAGDGLSEALSVQPKAIDYGEEVFYVLRGECTQINHKGDKNNILTRLHTIRADAITEIDGQTAAKMLTAAAEEIQRLKDEVAGQERLDLERQENDALAAERHEGNMGRPA